MTEASDGSRHGALTSDRASRWKEVARDAIKALDNARLNRLRPLVTGLKHEPTLFTVSLAKLRDTVASQPVPPPMKVFALRSFVPLDSEARQLTGTGIPEVSVAADSLALAPDFPAVIVPALVGGVDPSGRTRRSHGVVVEVYSSLLSGPVEVSTRDADTSVLVHLTPLGAVCAFYDSAAEVIVVAVVA